MTAVAFDLDLEGKAASHSGTVDDTYFAGRNIPAYVRAVAVVDVLFDQVGHEVLCRIRAFFSPFEHDDDPAGPLVFDFL